MKHLKEYNNWVTDVTGNLNVNYGDKKPKLSDVAVDVIKFIEDNYDKIVEGLNGTRENYISFEEGLKYESITIDKDSNHSNIPYIHFMYRSVNGSGRGYQYDITDYDYDYLNDYFYKIYKIFRKKDQEKDKEKYKLELQKIEDKKDKDREKKYNV